MTNLRDLLPPDLADRLARNTINIGDVYYLPLGKKNGISPKDGDFRNKFFVVLGFSDDGDVIGGVVTNSNINSRLSSVITDYYLPVSVEECPFLTYDSFVNCSNLVRAGRNVFARNTYRGCISEELRLTIIDTLKESPTVNNKLLEYFKII